MGLSAGATSQQDAVEKFFIGRMIIRQAKDEFGVHPGEEAVSDYIRGMRASPARTRSSTRKPTRHFIEKGIGRLGMTETDLRDLVSDVLASQEINAIVGSGLGVNREVVAQGLALDNQQHLRRTRPPRHRSLRGENQSHR